MEVYDREHVVKVAALARLSLTGPELTVMERQLNEVFRYLDNMRAFDLSKVRPFSHAEEGDRPLPTPLRPDEPGASLSLREALANAGQSEDGYLVVPRVMDAE